MRLFAAAATTVLATLLLASSAGRTLENPTRDLALRLLPSRPAAHTIIIAIDEPSLATIGRWPWSRATLASLIERAADAGARAVVLDILLPEAGPGDDALANATKRLPVFGVSVLDEQGHWLTPSPSLGSDLIAAHGNFEIDHDGMIRRFAATKQSHDRALTAIPFEAASIITGAPVPVGTSIAPAFRTHPKDIPRLSSVEAQAPRRISPMAGKLVFIGPTAFALGDRVLTPVSGRMPDPGVTVHAAATESVIRGEAIRDVSPLVSGLIAGVAVWCITRWRWASPLIALLVIGGGLLLLGTATVAVPFATLLICTLAAAATVETMRMMRALRQSRVAVTRLEASRGLLAHELKTPLASMSNLTQLLTAFELTDAERRRVTTLLQTEAGKLQSMVNVLLDLERLPQRDFASSTSMLNLAELVALRVEFLSAAGPDAQRLRAGRPLSELLVRGDSALLERVIDNLVSNALKYTRGEVVVSVRQIDDAAAIEVEDRGPGIAAADRERIFQRFFRGATAAGTQGLGLGLSFVTEVARWHGGSVTMEDVANGGTRFRVTLPMKGAGEWPQSS